MNRGELRDILMQHGLARVADALLDLSLPAVGILVHRVEESAIAIGSSKVGGSPDLPAGVEWPAWHEPMAFIGQLNLAEVAPYEQSGALPRHGLLSIFYETDGEPRYSARWGLPESTSPDQYPEIDESLGWRVLYFDADPATFIRRGVPDALNELGRFHPCAVRYTTDVTLPEVDGPEILPLGLGREERTALINLEFLVNRSSGTSSFERSPDGMFWPLPLSTGEEQGGHLLGYAYSLGGSALVNAERESQRIPYERFRDVYDHPERHLEYLREIHRKWCLLLQVDSGEQTGMDWAGGGVLHVCVEREALAGLDFSRVWLDLDFL